MLKICCRVVNVNLEHSPFSHPALPIFSSCTPHFFTLHSSFSHPVLPIFWTCTPNFLTMYSQFSHPALPVFLILYSPFPNLQWFILISLFIFWQATFDFNVYLSNMYSIHLTNSPLYKWKAPRCNSNNYVLRYLSWTVKQSDNYFNF